MEREQQTIRAYEQLILKRREREEAKIQALDLELQQVHLNCLKSKMAFVLHTTPVLFVLQLENDELECHTLSSAEDNIARLEDGLQTLKSRTAAAVIKKLGLQTEVVRMAAELKELQAANVKTKEVWKPPEAWDALSFI